jgi:fibronectin type 3 domain-containing protein
VVGLATGTLTINSNASNPILTIPLSGTGVSTTQHSVTLSWNASTSKVSGYNVYRSISSTGNFSKLNNSLIVPTTYVDTSVVNGTTYYYYATAVDGQGHESVPSNQSVATIP